MLFRSNGSVVTSSNFPTANPEYNYSLYFDGSGYLSFPSSTTWQMAGDFTIECWIYLTTIPSATAAIFLKDYVYGTNFPSYGSFLNTSGTVTFYITNNTGTPQGVATSAALSTNIWTHLAFVRNGSTGTIYVNGTSNASFTISTAMVDGGNYLRIGADNQPSEFYSGFISDFRITKGTALYTSNFVPPINTYNTALANTVLLTCQTNKQYNNSFVIDNSNFSSNNIITRTGNTSIGTFSPYGDNWSNYFNGSSALQISNNAAFNFGSGSFTIEAWVYLTSTANYQSIVSNYGGSTTGFCIQT